ncbi:hypothetical protein Sme01_03370 [Sphaerisporangium melleum]|uniref:Uncharacterized protein n=1 Tax=Sphaerisporangium melleum TaxID=321316 RepID=A0A917VBJ1_9ACTN|nr:hypothetical protein GCM10007964_00920 [Sphaerisporangium melleum]GII67861.1 hypothetical protein Sme01_03370 [Sphaerisporangium melleum]
MHADVRAEHLAGWLCHDANLPQGGPSESWAAPVGSGAAQWHSCLLVRRERAEG